MPLRFGDYLIVKSRRRFASCLAVVVSLTIAVPPGVTAQAQTTGQRAGEISRLIPLVGIQRASQTLTAAAKMPVLWADVLNTQVGARVRVALDDGSVLNIGSESSMHIVKHDAEAQQTELELVYGRVRSQAAKLAKPGGKFEVRTPAGVVGVVGTNFYVLYLNGVMLVIVFEGIVQFCNLAGMCVNVSEGQSSTTRANDREPPTPPQTATPQMLTEAAESTVISGNTPCMPGTDCGDTNQTSPGQNILVVTDPHGYRVCYPEGLGSGVGESCDDYLPAGPCPAGLGDCQVKPCEPGKPCEGPGEVPPGYRIKWEKDPDNPASPGKPHIERIPPGEPANQTSPGPKKPEGLTPDDEEKIRKAFNPQPSQQTGQVPPGPTQEPSGYAITQQRMRAFLERLQQNDQARKQGPRLSPEDVRNSVLPQGPATPTTVGIVVPAHAAGPFSGTVVPDPTQYEGIPSLQVSTVTVPLTVGRDGKPSLQNLMVDTGNGVLQPAEGPIVFFPNPHPESIEASELHVSLLLSGNRAEEHHVNIHRAKVSFTPDDNTKMNVTPARIGLVQSLISTSPLVFTNSITAVHGAGRFSGDPSKIVVQFDDQTVTPFAVTTNGFFFRVPASAQEGSHQLVFGDQPSTGRFAASTEITVLKLTTSVDQPVLRKGQRTNGHIGLSAGPHYAPDAWAMGHMWQRWAAGHDPDLTDLDGIHKVIPDFHPPQAGQPGMIFLGIQNLTPTITIAGFNGMTKSYYLTEDSLPFTVVLPIQAKIDGGFDIKVIAAPLVAPVRCWEYKVYLSPTAEERRNLKLKPQAKP